MDTALEILDPLVFDKAYAYFLPAKAPSALNSNATTGIPIDVNAAPTYGSIWARDNIIRQCISIFIVTQIGASAIYFFFSFLSYFFVFDRRLEYHPRFLKNQIRQEITMSMRAIPWINIMTLPFFLAEVRGHSLLYTRVDDYGWTWMLVSTVLFMIWNDFMIYWIHRLEHHPSVYKYVHKPHHKWISMFSPFPPLSKAADMFQSRLPGPPLPSTPSTAISSRCPTSMSYPAPFNVGITGGCVADTTLASSSSFAPLRNICTWFFSSWCRSGPFSSTTPT